MSDVASDPERSDPHVSRRWRGLASILCGDDFKPWLPGRHRAHELRDALSRVWSVQRQIGVTRVARLTDYDYVGIPVAGTIRPAVADAQITATQGKGLTEAEALVSALMEAAERHAAAQPLASKRATARELAASGREHASLGSLGIQASNDAELEWVVGHSLKDAARTLIPRAAVSFPYFVPQGLVRPLHPSTTGLAAGGTLAEALTQALFEVLERDAVSRFLEGEEFPLLDLSSLGPSTEAALVRRFSDQDVRVFVADLSATSPVSVYFACGFNPDGPGPTFLTAGQGAHLSPRIALRRALLELAQSRVVALQGSREDLVRHASDWQETPEESRETWLGYRALCARLPPRSLPSEGSPGNCGADSLSALLSRLDDHGYEQVLFVELTQPRIALPVVRALIPGCVDTFVDPDRRRTHVFQSRG